MELEFLMLIGFALAAYSIIANDSIQTLGTFIASNAHRPWWLLWAFASSVLITVVLIGWYLNQGDPAFGRLEKFPWPDNGIQWYHILPPLVILALTRFGVPVSTTFMVLIVFNPKNIDAMLTKSLLGYGVAFFVSIILYRFVIRQLNAHFLRTQDQPIHWGWVVLSGHQPLSCESMVSSRLGEYLCLRSAFNLIRHYDNSAGISCHTARLHF